MIESLYTRIGINEAHGGIQKLCLLGLKEYILKHTIWGVQGGSSHLVTG